MPRRLFIYGTLKGGAVNHHLLADEIFLGQAATVPRFRLLHLGWYPGLAETEGEGVSVQGELWEVSDACLRRLDAYEGSRFQRPVIELLPGTGEVVGKTAEAYLLRRPDWSRPDAGASWDPPGSQREGR